MVLIGRDEFARCLNYYGGIFDHFSIITATISFWEAGAGNLQQSLFPRKSLETVKGCHGCYLQMIQRLRSSDLSVGEGRVEYFFLPSETH